MIALLAALAAGLREMTDPQFADLLAKLRRELAPSTALEGFYVERALLFAGRLRKAARLEDAAAPPSSAWLRYEAMAERGFWRALAALDKGRKPQGKAREKAPTVAVAVAPAPTPAPPAAQAPTPGPNPSGARGTPSYPGPVGPPMPAEEGVPRAPIATPTPPTPAPAAPVAAPKPAPSAAPAPKPTPTPAPANRPEPKLLKALGKRRPPAPKLPPFPPALPGGDLLHLSITSKPSKHRVDDYPMPFEI